MAKVGETSAPADRWSEQRGAEALARTPGLAQRNAAYIARSLTGIAYNPNPDLIPLRPIVLSARTRSALDTASAALVSLIHKTCWSLTDEPAELARRTGVRPEQIPLLSAGGDEQEIAYSASNGRLDVLLRNGEPLFLEANFSAANLDPVVQHFLLAAYRELYELKPLQGAGVAWDLFEARARLYRKICRDRNLPVSVAIVGSMSESSVGDHRYYDAEVAFLRAHGIDSAFVEMSSFAGGGGAGGRSVAVKHFLSEYWEPMGLPLKAVAAAHAGSVFIVPDSGRSLTSKLVFAWLSAEDVPLTGAERDFVRRHIPWTRRTGPDEVEFEGRGWRLSDLAVAQRPDFVLKPLTSCGGRGVLLGRNASPDTWRRRIDDAVRQRNHVLQRIVEADALEMDYFDRVADELRREAVTYVLGAYMVGGANAGCNIRHVPGATSGIVNLERGAAFNLVL